MNPSTKEPGFVKKVKEIIKDQPEGEEIMCTPADMVWVQDPNGYFTVKPFPEEGVIKVRYYTNDHQRKYLFVGKTPQEIYFTIFKRGLVSKLDHAAYLGKELEKAYLALKYGFTYVQDDEMVLR